MIYPNSAVQTAFSHLIEARNYCFDIGEFFLYIEGPLSAGNRSRVRNSECRLWGSDLSSVTKFVAAYIDRWAGRAHP